MHRICSPIICLALMAGVIACGAASADSESLRQLAGASIDVKPINDLGYIDIVVSRSNVENNILDIYPLLNRDLANAAFGAGPTRKCIYVGEALAGAALAMVYDLPAVDKVHLLVQLRSTDKFGQNRNEKLFSLDMDRETASKINWAQFNPRNFYRVAKHFTTTATIKQRMYTEEFSYDPEPSGD